MPWMLCSPKPLLSRVGHSSASTATVSDPKRSFRWSPAPIVPADPVAETNARTLSSGLRGRQVLDDALERGARRQAVDDVVTELAELVQDDVVGVLGELVATVVDLLDVALGARAS